MPTYDLSLPLGVDTRVFPGDPSFRADKLKSLASGDDFDLCHLHLGNHLGTHIDFPAHVIKGGKTSSDFPLASLIGHGIIIACPIGAITKEFIEQHKAKIHGKKFVFFKTLNSDFSYIEEKGAKELVSYGIKIVGIDGLSVDAMAEDNLLAHHTFLANDVLIVEGLNLRDVPEGEGEIIIAPLPIPIAIVDARIAEINREMW